MAGGGSGDRDAAVAEAELRAGFETLAVTRPDPSLDRIPTARAMSLLDRIPTARAVVLSATGPHICAGIELRGPGNPLAAGAAEPVAAAEALRRAVLDMQAALT